MGIESSLGQRLDAGQRLAVVDCGSNTFSLLVAEVVLDAQGQWGWKKIQHHPRYVHLGRGSFRSGTLDRDRMRRGWDVLGMFVEAMRNTGVVSLACLATSAVRDAKNKAEFLRGAAELGCPIQVIDGLTEAALVQRAVRQTVEAAAPDWSDCTLASLDIGGGSVEMSLWTGDTVHYSGSLNIGLSRLTDWIKPKDWWSPKDLESAAAIIADEMKPFLKAAAAHAPRAWVGSSGTIKALQQLLTPDEFPGYEVADLLPSAELFPLLDRLIPMHQNALRKLPNLHPDRVPYIALGSTLVRHALKASGSDQLFCSRFAMAEAFLSACTSSKLVPASGLPTFNSFV